MYPYKPFYLNKFLQLANHKVQVFLQFSNCNFSYSLVECNSYSLKKYYQGYIETKELFLRAAY